AEEISATSSDRSPMIEPLIKTQIEPRMDAQVQPQAQAGETIRETARHAAAGASGESADSRSLRRSGMPSALRVRVVDSSWEFSALRREWNEIAAVSYATAFQSHEWLSRWWKHFGNNPSCELHIVLFFRGDRLAGIAPMFLESTRIAGQEIF